MSLKNYTPERIRNRQKNFIMVPMRWWERLNSDPPAHGCSFAVAFWILYLDWKNHGKPFLLANCTLRYYGVSRQSKWRALADLERRKLIRVERRGAGKSPLIHLLAERDRDLWLAASEELAALGRYLTWRSLRPLSALGLASIRTNKHGLPCCYYLKREPPMQRQLADELKKTLVS